MDDFNTYTCVSVTLPVEMLLRVLTDLSCDIVTIRFSRKSIVVSDQVSGIPMACIIPVYSVIQMDCVSMYNFNIHPVTGKMINEYRVVTSSKKILEVVEAGNDSVVTLYAMTGQYVSEVVVLMRLNDEFHYNRISSEMSYIPAF